VFLRVKKKTMNDNVVVGIVMTSLNAGSKNMVSALEHFGWNYVSLSLGKPWSGFMVKSREYAVFAESQEPNYILVLIDSYDALPIRRPDQFQEAFEKFGMDIVVGAENYCDPANCIPINKPNQNLKIHPNVQSGCIVGRAHALSKMFNWIVKEKIQDDQIGVAKYINTHLNEKIDLDDNCILSFHDNWGNTCKIDIENNNDVVIRKNNISYKPWFIHFPGFLWKRTVMLPLQPFAPMDLENYDQVGKHILKNEFVNIGQVDKNAYYALNIAILVLVSVLVFLLVLFITMYVYERRRRIKNTPLIELNEF
jgi:hypothetical protein